jgi:hypothetical protein
MVNTASRVSTSRTVGVHDLGYSRTPFLFEARAGSEVLAP